MERRNPGDREALLDAMFRAYRAACPDASADFMPNLWARIEAHEVSTNWFARVAKALVAAALAASVLLGMMISSRNQSSAFFDATFVQALRADDAAKLEPFRLDRLSESDLQ